MLQVLLKYKFLSENIGVPHDFISFVALIAAIHFGWVWGPVSNGPRTYASTQPSVAAGFRADLLCTSNYHIFSDRPCSYRVYFLMLDIVHNSCNLARLTGIRSDRSVSSIKSANAPQSSPDLLMTSIDVKP